jgi:hypothetical protein
MRTTKAGGGKSQATTVMHDRQFDSYGNLYSRPKARKEASSLRVMIR